jgi:putative oxidoreductase
MTPMDQTVWGERTRAVLRMAIAFMVWQHGAQKLIGFPTGTPPVELASLMGVAGIIEFFGSILLFVGLFTRPVAFVMSGELASAYFIAHAPKGFWPILNQGELAATFSFACLFFAVVGAGAWSVDRVLHRRRRVDLGAPAREVPVRAVR